MDNKLELRVTLEPNLARMHELVNIGRMLAAKGDAKYVIDGVNFFPHITLYTLAAPEYNLGKIEYKLSEIVKEFNQISLQAGELKKGYDGYIISLIEKTPELYSLHKKIVMELNPLREGLAPHTHVSKNELSNVKLEVMEKYGHHNVLEGFDPHVTFVRYNSPDKAESLLKKIHLLAPKILFDRVQLSQWSSKKLTLIAEFQLK